MATLCVLPHPHAQLAIVLQGQCDYYVDGKPYRMKEGSWVFVPADVGITSMSMTVMCP